MNFKMISNAFIKNKTVMGITMLFISGSVLLLSLSVMFTINLFGSINQLMENAKTPHFMQMHTGNIDEKDLANFKNHNSNVEDFQIVSFINIDNDQIALNGKSLINSLQDNGIVIQNKSFDYLLNFDNEIVHPSPGEIYVPISYYQKGDVEVGNQVSIYNKTLRIAGFIRDSQMNSSLASSKRFVVNEKDYQQLEKKGQKEYLIEFRLHDLSSLSAFETAYNKAKLPANGPTLTWSLFQMISALSDGLMIGLMIFISLVAAMIALLCIRFTILAKLEDDYREIGVMKAIGIRMKSIKRMYLFIYVSMVSFASIIGYLCSIFLLDYMLVKIYTNLGQMKQQNWGILFGALITILILLLIIIYINLILRKFYHISPREAIQFGYVQESSHSKKLLLLSNNHFLTINMFIGLKDLLVRKQLYLTVLIISILSSFIMIVPQNMYTTVSNSNFVTYMGIGAYDMRIDIQGQSLFEEKQHTIIDYMNQDYTLNQYVTFTTKPYLLKKADGTFENIKIELGNHDIFPLQYIKGAAPKTKFEIALPSLLTDDLDKSIGDYITILKNNQEIKLTITGIFSDITNGGKVAKANFIDEQTGTAWSTICATFKNPSQEKKQVKIYTDKFSFAKVSSITNYITQTFGQTLSSLRQATIVAIFIASLLILLVIMLFMKLLVAKDRYSIGLIKALGFNNHDIVYQYLWRIIFILALGILMGILLANTVGEMLAGTILSALGINAFQFTINPILTYLLSPMLLIFAALLATVLGIMETKKININESIRE